MEQQIASAYRSMSGFESKFTEGMHHAKESTESLSGSIMHMAEVIGAAELGKEILHIGADMEQTRIAYQTLVKDIKGGDELLETVKKWSDVSSFTPRTAFDAGQKLISLGIAAKDLIPTLNNLSDLSMGNLEKFNRLVDVYSMANIRRQVDTKEIRSLATSGVDFYTGIEKAKGLKEGQGKEWFESRDMVGIGDLNQAIMAMTGKGGLFQGMTEKMAETVNVKWTTTLGQMEEVAVSTFDKMKPSLILVSNGYRNLENISLRFLV